MTTNMRLFTLALSLTALAACANAGDRPTMIGTSKTSLGPVLTDTHGMTLYTFDKDPSGKSVCNGKCAENWPPLAAAADAKPTGEFSIIMRDDGSKQWAYEGKPLYGWVKDTKPGDVTGHRFNNVWTAAMAEGSGY